MQTGAWNKVNYLIAKQYFLARKRQSLLAILGVIFGVATFVVLLGFMTGVNDFLDNAVFKGNPDLVIQPEKKITKGNSIGLEQLRPLENVDGIESILKNDENVAAYARQVLSPAILINGTQLATQIHGVDPNKEMGMVDLHQRLTSGAGFESIKKQNSVLLGIGIARQLAVEPGDNILIVLPNRKKIQLKVSGIFSFGISIIDNYRAYMHIDRLEHLLSKNPLTTHIHVKLKDRDELGLKNRLVTEIEQIGVTDWKEGNKTIVAGNKVRHVLTWTISLALLLVAGFGIFNILNNTVVQKRKDIAVLKTAGYQAGDITAIFSMQSLAIGLIGSIVGILAGYLISLTIAGIPLETDDFIIAETYPVSFNPLFYLTGLLFGLLTALLSGYYPAKSASKVDPVLIIRGL